MAQENAVSPSPAPRTSFFANVGALVFARAFLTASQLLILPIIARYLAVEDFALMALAMTVVVFSSVLSDGGLGRSLIRTKEYDLTEWSTVFWLIAGVGAILSMAVLAIAPLWAWFFDQPRIWSLLSCLAIVPLLQALSAAPNAEIERRERYAGLASVQIIAAVVGMAAAVALVMLGAGVWALVAQQILLALVRLAGIAVLTRFRPSFVFANAVLGQHLRFARDAIAVSLIQTGQMQTPVVAIGKFLGESALGFYAMNQRFARLPQFGIAGPMSAVVYVRMAKVQDSGKDLVRIYLASSRLLAAALFPALAMLSAAGTPVFTLLLGDKWAPVASIFALSIPGLTFEAVTVTYLACLLRAAGRTTLQVQMKIEGAIVAVILFVAAAFISLEAVAASITLWSLFYVPRAWILTGRVAPIGWKACIEAVIRPVLFSAVGVVAHLSLSHAVAPGIVAEIAMAIGLMLGVYGILIILDWHSLRTAVTSLL
ncbi:MAG: oligosaccharide flippase family protein [Pseudomonadota bacterium]